MKERNRFSYRFTVWFVSIIFLLSGMCVSSVWADQSRFGGTLVVALGGSPPNLDMTMTTGGEVGTVMPHVYEALFEFNNDGEPQAHLASSYLVENDGLRYRFNLRKGVRFHNGKEMTSEDAFASVQRWLKVNNGGKKIAPYVESIKVTGKYQFVMNLKQTVGPILNIMGSWVANQRLLILTKEIVEAAGSGLIKEHIGTGPYKLDGWVPDQNVRLVRNDDYTPNLHPSSGYAGLRVAYYDAIDFRFVPEQAIRVAGVQTGEYHYALSAPMDLYPSFEQNPDITPLYVNSYEQMLAINTANPPFNNIKARQALAYGMDMDDLGRAMIGDPRFWYATDGSLFAKQTMWYDPTAGKGIYNVKDIKKAQQLLKQSGYDGRPVIILNNRANKVESQGAIALKAQMEKIGFKVQLDLLDRATNMERRKTKDAWHLHLTYFSSVNPDPQVWSAWAGTNGWITNWDDKYSKETDEIFNRMSAESNPQKRYGIVQEWYTKFWETLPYIKTVNWGNLHLKRSNMKGGDESRMLYHYFFNTWLEK